MSRATVKTALAAWIAPPIVTGVNLVRTAFPTFIDGGSFIADPGLGTGAVVVLHITADHEERVAMGGPASGYKRIHYDLDLHIFHLSYLTDSETQDASELADAAFDETVEALKVRLRADRTWGTGANATSGGFAPGIFQAGEEQLSGRYGIPGLVGGALATWAVITTTVSEFIQS